jgi:hypothetical protein
MFLKCRAGLNYHLVLGPFFWEDSFHLFTCNNWSYHDSSSKEKFGDNPFLTMDVFYFSNLRKSYGKNRKGESWPLPFISPESKKPKMQGILHTKLGTLFRSFVKFSGRLDSFIF